MANFNPTKAQQQAIDDRGKNILVSASAGSGKTAVLVNRTIKLIQEGHRIDRMLLVTFTEAAAKNMRDKIRQALEEIVRDSSRPKKLRDRMRGQINLLAAADISTIHAFCLKLIKRYYYLINLDPQFRLLTDETERVLLQEDVWHELSERYYQTADHQEVGMASFSELVLNFSSDRDDTGLDELVLKLADLATAQPDPEAWLKSLAANYDLAGDLLASPFYHQVQELVSSRLKQLEQDYAELIARAGNDGLDKTAGILKDDQSQIQRLIQTLVTGSSWDAIRGEFNTVKFKRMSGKPKDDPVALATYADITDTRKEIKDRLTKVTARYFEYDEQQLRQLSDQAQAILRKLSAVTIEFRHQYQQAKLNRHVLEFSDLEHYAHQILTPPADDPDWQKLVSGLREHYQDIMIDEYQDTNRLQESILMKLASPKRHNLFMVGDVKQSIYRFREADPSLFIGKYDRYLAGDGGESIVLAENFRSMTNITGLTNLIFEQLMDHEVGEIDYDQPAHLKYAAKYYEDNPDNHPQPTEIMLYDANGDETSSDPAKHEDDKLAGELRMVALRIKRMVAQGEQIYDAKSKQMRPIEYGDIVLLERTKTINNTLMDEFNQAGVPLTVHDVESYFQATEVRVMMALLKIIDNPMQDIPLVAVLRSPIVGLDNQELAFIRLQNRSADYYEAVQSFIDNYHEHRLQQQSLLPATKIEQLATKVTRFLDQLTTFRQTAQQQSIVDLIWQIYNMTGYLDYVGAMPGGQQRQANLHALYQRAFGYEQSSFKGLYQFIRFIEKMQEHEKDLGIAPTQLSNDTVNVMTIHGSKGLQFPIVFLIDATHGFNQGAGKDNAVVDANAGIGIKYLNNQRVQYDTPQRQVALAKVQQSDRAEDMRVLYVALTRAEQRLVITGSFNEDSQASRRQHLANAWQRWQKAYQSNELVLGTQARINANSFMDWIGLALARYPQFSPEAVGTKQVQLATSSLAASNSLTLPTKPNFTVKTYTQADLENENETLAEKQPVVDQSGQKNFVQNKQQPAISNILAYQYPHQTATQTTAYQSVTDVKRVFEDPDEQRIGKWDYDPQRKTKKQGIYLNTDFAVPKFIRQEDSQPTPTAVGTATHLVFQQLPLRAEQEVTLTEVEAEIDRLVDAGLIAPIVAKQINRDGIVGFFETAVGKRILQAPQDYHREVPFSMLMNGHELFKDVKASDDEQILIHGIIDGYLQTDQGIILVDYKTDHLNPNYRELELVRIVDRYRGQLRLYQEALNIMERVPVVQTGLYLVELKEFIPIQEGD